MCIPSPLQMICLGLRRFAGDRHGSYVVEAALLLPLTLGIAMAVIEFGFIFMRDLTVKNYISQMVQRIERGQADITPVVTALAADGLMAGRSPQVCTGLSPAACSGNNRLSAVTIGQTVTVGVTYNFIALTPVGNLLGIHFPPTLTRRETVTVGSVSKRAIDYSQCRFVSNRGGPPAYISTVTCGSGEVMVSPGGSCEVPGSNLCAGTSMGYMHYSGPSHGIFSHSVDCFSYNMSGDACSEAFAYCCAYRF